MSIRPGTPLRVRDANAVWHEAMAASSPEGQWGPGGRRIHDFPVVWVKFTTKGDPVPWPLDAVEVLP